MKDGEHIKVYGTFTEKKNADNSYVSTPYYFRKTGVFNSANVTSLTVTGAKAPISPTALSFISAMVTDECIRIALDGWNSNESIQNTLAGMSFMAECDLT